MPSRQLTANEKSLLRPVFGTTLPYDDQYVDRNDAEYGGRTNSITLGIVPHMAISIWSLDYGGSSVSDDDKGIFIHEMGHVWYWYHGGSNMRGGIWTGIKMFVRGKDYEDSYYYDLSESTNLKSYNLEQMASIIEDFWHVDGGRSPKHNIGRNKSLAAYTPFIGQVRTAGPPPTPEPLERRPGRGPIRPL